MTQPIPPHNAPDSTLALQILPLKAGLPLGQPHKTKALIRLVSSQPLPSSVNERAPLDLAIVIDRSGSMSGGPLAAAKAAAQNLIRGLGSADRVAVLVFDDKVDVLQPLGATTDREAIAAKVAQVRSGGSTALFDGWEAGAKQLLDQPDAGRTRRVILLTDGQANRGLVDEDAIAAKVAEATKAGVTTTTVGLGGAFEETLLGKMADAGNGQSHFGQRPEDLEEGFAEEFSLINATHLRDLEFRVAGGTGVIAELLLPDGKRGAAWRAGSLPCTASRDAVVELTLGADRGGATLAVTATGRDGEGATVTVGPVVLTLPEVEPAAFAVLPADPIVAAAIAESDFADEFLRIHELARRGELQEALAALRELRQRPGATEWATRTASYIVGLADDDLELAIKELAYSGRAFRTRSKAVYASEAYNLIHDSHHEASAAEHLAKKIGMGRSRKRSRLEEGGAAYAARGAGNGARGMGSGAAERPPPLCDQQGTKNEKRRTKKRAEAKSLWDQGGRKG
jgi:Ca-activated chloride channel family protein